MMTSQLLINEPPLQVLPTLAQTIGLNEAIILQQIHYWLAPKLNQNYFSGRHWVRNTYEQWQSQFPFWGEKTIRRTITNLEEAGIVMSFVTKDLKRIKYYTLDYNKLETLVTDPAQALQKLAVNQGAHPFGQIDHLDLPKQADRSGQSDQVDLVKMTRCYDMDSENTYSENTHPPLSPPSNIFPLRKASEEEEEKEISFFKNNPDNPPKPRVLKMLEIWNQTVQWKFYSGKEAHLTSKRKMLMNTLLKTVLGDAITSWKDYCTLIANSRFLSGENARGFKATLDWALIPDNAYKVLEGAIYDQPKHENQSHVIPTWEEFAEELVRTLPSNKLLLPWLKVSINLAKDIGQLKYKSWFSKVFLSDLTDKSVTLSVRGKFIRDYIATHFETHVRCAVRSIYPDIDQINYLIIHPNGDAL